MEQCGADVTGLHREELVYAMHVFVVILMSHCARVCRRSCTLLAIDQMAFWVALQCHLGWLNPWVASFLHYRMTLFETK